MRTLLVVGIVAVVACDAGIEARLRQDAAADVEWHIEYARPRADAAIVRELARCESKDFSDRCLRSAALPTTKLEEATIGGAISKAIVRRRVKREIQKIMYCYEKTLLAKPDLLGTVTVQFFIAPTGEVWHVSASGVDPDITSCVERVFEAMTFPANHQGTTVTYPITFRPTGD